MIFHKLIILLLIVSIGNSIMNWSSYGGYYKHRLCRHIKPKHCFCIQPMYGNTPYHYEPFKHKIFPIIPIISSKKKKSSQLSYYQLKTGNKAIFSDYPHYNDIHNTKSMNWQPYGESNSLFKKNIATL